MLIGSILCLVVGLPASTRLGAPRRGIASDARATRLTYLHAAHQGVRATVFTGGGRAGSVSHRPHREALGMLSGRPGILNLRLNSRPDTAGLARAALGVLGKSFLLRPELVNDLKTAVSEACNNAVDHAYRGQSGAIAVRLEIMLEERRDERPRLGRRVSSSWLRPATTCGSACP